MSIPEDFGFGQLFWEMPDAVVVVDMATGRIALWNPAAEDLFAIPGEAAIGLPLETLIPAAFRDRDGAGLAGYRETEHGTLIDAGLPIELPALRGSGEPIMIELRLSPIAASRVPGHFVLAIIRDVTVRKQAEQDRLHLAREQAARVVAEHAAEALRLSEERFRTAFEYASLGMDVVDLEGRFLRVNAALCRLFGYTESELLALTFQDITHPDDLSGDFTQVELLLAGEIPALRVEKRYLRKDGEVIWARINSAIVRDPSGAPLYYISQIEDITDRKQADAELAQRTEDLRASESRFRTLVEQLPAAVYLLETKENRETPLYFSPSITAVTGETPAEALISHQHWFDLVHPEDRELVAAADAQSDADEDAFHAEYRHRRTDGTYVWVQDECAPVKDATGRVVVWQGILLDITDRIRAEEAQAQLAAIVDAAEDGILSCSLQGTILSWNHGAERLYGYLAEEALGQSVAMLRPPDLADDIAEDTARVRQGESIEGHETVRLTRDGRRVDVSLSITPMRDPRGAVVSIASISRDITARKVADAALRDALERVQANVEAKDRFLAMMSHELRTPLQSVLGYADLLLRAPSGALNAEQREDLDAIQRGATRMVTLIDQNLDLSRMKAGQVVLERASVDLTSLLQQVCQDLAPEADVKGIALKIDGAGVPPIVGDLGRVYQVLLNLTGNAVKFTLTGEVRLSAHPTEIGVAVNVRDTGIGIDPLTLEHIFEEYHQGEGGRERRFDGTGLGLAIARRLAHDMGGRITVESELGHGSCFTLHLPLEPASALTAPR